MTTRYEKQKKCYEEEKAKRSLAIKWDRESIIILIVIIAFITSSIILLNIDFKGYYVKNKSDWSITCGKIISINSIDNMVQTRGGNKFVTEGYNIKYEYTVGKIIYQDSIFLFSRIIKNKLLINEIRSGDSRKIYYNNTNPRESDMDRDLSSTCE